MLLTTIAYPGLTDQASQIPALLTEVIKREAALAYKQSSPCPWIVFMGGTGTGKSTLFNAFCGKPISDVGVERPKTSGPILYAHEACSVSAGFPVTGLSIEESTWEASKAGVSKGHPDRLLLFTHAESVERPFVVVDTPDLDSVEGIHRDVAEDFYLLADAVVFVASQEKYADEIPCRFLAKVIKEECPVFFLLNKVHDSFSPEEIVESLRAQGILLCRNHIWLIPYEGGDPSNSFSRDKAFLAFSSAVLDEVVRGSADSLGANGIARRKNDLRQRAEHLLGALNRETELSRQWLGRLSQLCTQASVSLLEEEKKRYMLESSFYIQREVKKLFSRYDILAKPRRFVQAAFRAPLELLGIIKAGTHPGQKETLSKVRGRIAFTPIFRTIEQLNRQALEVLSPKDASAPLYHAIRQPHVFLSEDDVTAFILKEQDLLDRWVEARFQRLADDLPKAKKWGIYSTSILWGILILSFEVIVGGGFTVLDAALDSVIAPFVTKGAVGLFASREIKQIARQLASRYEDGLLSVIVHQKKRYENCLAPLLPQEQSLEALRALAGS